MKACWLKSKYQNPLGFKLTDGKKRQIVDILKRYNADLIEDDVYRELYEGSELVNSMKMYKKILKLNFSIAPGKMFNLTIQYNHGIRLNASLELDNIHTRIFETLSSCIGELINE